VKEGLLFYDGATYRLQAQALHDLAQRGVIIRDEQSGYYMLAADHLIEEVEPDAEVLSRLTGSIARAQERPDVRSLAAQLKAPNSFGGRR